MSQNKTLQGTVAGTQLMGSFGRRSIGYLVGPVGKERTLSSQNQIDCINTIFASTAREIVNSKQYVDTFLLTVDHPCSNRLYTVPD